MGRAIAVEPPGGERPHAVGAQVIGPPSRGVRTSLAWLTNPRWEYCMSAFIVLLALDVNDRVNEWGHQALLQARAAIAN